MFMCVVSDDIGIGWVCLRGGFQFVAGGLVVSRGGCQIWGPRVRNPGTPFFVFFRYVWLQGGHLADDEVPHAMASRRELSLAGIDL